jgi:hypothetical protein
MGSARKEGFLTPRTSFEMTYVAFFGLLKTQRAARLGRPGPTRERQEQPQDGGLKARRYKG